MSGPAEPPLVVALVADLFFAVRIAEAVRAAGGRPEILASAAELWPAIENWPALVVIDLSVRDDWPEAVRRAKNLPQTRSIPVIAFGSHVEADTLRAARAAGCDHAWARSRFVSEFPAFLKRVLSPPTRWPDGWDEPPPPGLCAGIAQFNEGEYWECHETLEELWRAEKRPIRDLYQGILQIAVAFHHLRGRNYPGALKMFRRGIPRLRGLPDLVQGVPVTDLLGAAQAIHDRLVALGPDAIGQFDVGTLPRIHLTVACV